MDRINSLLKNPYTLSHVAAVFLHLLLFLIYAPLTRAWVTQEELTSADANSSPVTFEFVEVPRQDRSEKLPEQTPLLSDRHSVARDMPESSLPSSYLPYSEGLMDEARDRQTTPGSSGPDDLSENDEAHAEQSESPDQLDLAFWEMKNATDFMNRSDLDGSQARSREEAVYGRPSSDIQLENRQVSAVERGNFQLSTYEWDFAPYMADFKRRVESNIFPPPAWDLGMVEGRTVLNIRIMRDGSLELLKVERYDGSELLRDTNLRAVQLSAPFQPLPDHFPDPHLDIRYLFLWKIIRYGR